MDKAGRVLVMSEYGPPLLYGDMDTYASYISKTLYSLQTPIIGLMYEEGKGLYLVGFIEDLQKSIFAKQEIEEFDFKHYMSTTKDPIFWYMDYFNENGPTFYRVVEKPDAR